MPEFLLFLHRTVGETALYYLVALALWAFVSYIRRKELSSSFSAALVIGEVVLITQFILGVVLLVYGGVPRDWLHIAYGTFAALGIPIVASYLSGTSGRRRTLVYAIVLVILFGLAFRAYMTGR